MQAVWKRYVDCTYQCALSSNATHSNKIWLFPFSGSAETLLKKNAEPILHIAGLDVTIVKVIDFSLILTSYTLQKKKLVCIFSILFLTHSLRCWQGEFVYLQ